MIPASFRKVLPYALVVFFGYVGFSLPLPILPEMFLDEQVGILAGSYSREIKTILLGIVMAAYPFGQLFGAPLLGRCSDRWGRKTVILWSLVGSMVGYVITALAAEGKGVVGIFFGLFFCGLCEGNVAIAQSVVADLAASSKEKDHTVTHFAWINLFTCFAFILGPLAGGLLSDSSYISWFTFSTPFWMAGLMTLVGIIIILKYSQETRKTLQKEESESYWGAWKQGISYRRLRVLYGVNFFLALGYFSYFRFFPVYIEKTFSFSSSKLGYVIAYGSCTFALFSMIVLKPLRKKMAARAAVSLFSCVMALSFILVLIPSYPASVWWTTLPISLSLSVVMTYAAILVSEVAPQGFQGQAFGMLTSVQVMAEVLTGLLGGVLAGWDVHFPMIGGACMLLVGAIILWSKGRK